MSVVVTVHGGSTPWDTPGSLLGTLGEDFGRRIFDQHNDTGSATVRLLRDSAEAPLIQPYRVLRFYVDGSAVPSFAIRLGDYDQSTISAGEESDEVLTVTAPGLLATLKDAIVAPHPDQGRLQSSERVFSFATPEYSATAEYATWVAAVELFLQGDDALSYYGDDVPEDWPDPTAHWIWSEIIDLGNDPPSPVGDAYFRREVLLAESDYAAFIACDDGYELWVDGVLVSAQTEAFAFRKYTRVDLFLSAGTHTFAVKGTNIDRVSSATNGAALVFALYSTTAGGELSTLELHSDSTWKCLGYPAQPPGFTPGEILETLMGEAWDRNGLWLWWIEFTAALDTAGNAWTSRVEIAFRVGETLLDVVRKLCETHIDVAVDYDVLNLRAYNKGGRNTGAAVAYAVGTDVEDLNHRGEPGYLTTPLVHNADDTYTWVAGPYEGVETVENPRLEVLLEAGSSPSPASAAKHAEGLFDRWTDPKATVTGTLVPTAGKLPWQHVWPGKVVTLPGMDGTGVSTTILSVTVVDRADGDDGDGSYVFAIEGLQEQ